MSDENLEGDLTFDQILGRKLRVLRLSKNYTQEQLAEVLGVTFQQVQKYEKGANRISASTLFCVCAHFRISSSYFFEDPPWWKDISLSNRDLALLIALPQIPPSMRSAIEQCILAAEDLVKKSA